MDDMDEIYRLHAQAVYKYLLTLCRNPDLAEELTQETFYQAVRSIDRFDGKCKIPVWLCQIGKHLYYKELRKSGREAAVPEDFEIPAPSAEDIIIGRQDRTELLKAVHSLKDPYKEVVYLRSFGNLSFREIAEVMGKSENWARVTFYRGKEKLKGGFKDEKRSYM